MSFIGDFVTGALSGATTGASVGGIKGAVVGGVIGGGLSAFAGNEQRERQEQASRRAERRRLSRLQSASNAEAMARRQTASLSQGSANFAPQTPSSANTIPVGAAPTQVAGNIGNFVSSGTF